MINRYRIFDIIENNYCEESDNKWFLTRNGKLYNSERDEYYIPGEHYIIEFSTGIKDIDDYYIYDGDIIEGVSNNIFSNGEINRYEVFWGKDSWHINDTLFSLQELFNYCNNKIKIVSNTHKKNKIIY